MRTPRRRGVTLVELVIVITLVGVVASLSATLVSRVAASQQDNRGRLVLAQSADGAVARISDELQVALPNSVRLVASTNSFWLEWAPVHDAGRFRAASDSLLASGDPLDLDNPADASFDVIGTPISTVPSGSQLVIQSLGTPDADAYAGNNRRAGLVVTSGGRSVQFTPAGALPQATDTRRFFVTGTPVTLACVSDGVGGYELARYSGYGWQASQPSGTAHAAWGGAARVTVLAGLSGCGASYGTALANIGMVTLRLSLGSGSSKADYLHQVTVDNSP